MADKKFNARLQMKIDTEANFEAVKDSFVPLKGEMIIVQTSTGDRLKIGDGSSPYKNLAFQDAHVMDLINNLVTGVSSVNGETGAVQLTANDVGALASDGKAVSAGSADTATSAGKLTNSHKIGNADFNGTADITLAQIGALAVNGKAASATEADHATSADTADSATNATNATNATKATQDSAGQQINTTYIKGLSVSGTTITYTKGDDTTGTITTQDTNTTYSVMSPATASSAGTSGLVPAPGSGKQSSFLRGDGTWQEVSAGGGSQIFYGSTQPDSASGVKNGDLWLKVL